MTSRQPHSIIILINLFLLNKDRRWHERTCIQSYIEQYMENGAVFYAEKQYRIDSFVPVYKSK